MSTVLGTVPSLKARMKPRNRILFALNKARQMLEHVILNQYGECYEDCVLGSLHRRGSPSPAWDLEKVS